MPPKHENCPYEKDKDNWLDSRFLKMLGLIVALASPYVVWVTVEIFSLKSDMALVKQKQEVLIEMKNNIELIREDVTAIKIKLAGQK